jgi:CRP/FNR family transcriptional regulator
MTPSTVTPDLWPDPQARELAREALALLKDHLHNRHFRKGNLLWREGDTSGMLVRIKTGRVKVYRLLPNGRAVTLYLFGPDDVFGFLPFLDGQEYPAYAQALEDVEAEVMARSALLQALRAEPDLAVTLIGLLGQRLRAAFDLIRDLSTPTARARVARALCALISPDPASGPAPPEVRLPVSAHEFAGALGLSPEAFSRALTAMAQDGLLERTGPTSYRVLDPAALEEEGA